MPKDLRLPAPGQPLKARESTRLQTPTGQYRNVLFGADGTVSLRRVDPIFDPVVYEVAS